MSTVRTIMTELAAAFPPDAISWRVGSTTSDKSKGMALAFLDARDVQARLDAVMGADWQCEYVPMADGTSCCRIGLKIDGEWRWRANGAGATDVEGEKGRYSDSFKRAAVMWGIGVYLYNTDSPWLDLVQKGRTHVFAPGQENKLRAALNKAAPRQSKASANVHDAMAEPERQERIAAAHEADPHSAAAEAVAASKPEPKPSLSSDGAMDMIASLGEVSTVSELTAWERRHGITIGVSGMPAVSGSGPLGRLSNVERDSVKRAWQARRLAVLPKGSIGRTNHQAPMGYVGRT